MVERCYEPYYRRSVDLARRLGAPSVEQVEGAGGGLITDSSQMVEAMRRAVILFVGVTLTGD
jgi:hypothetical protein